MGQQHASSHSAGPTIAALVAVEGTSASSWAATLATTRESRDLADAVHVLCTMYGGHPCLIDAAAARIDAPPLSAWLAEAAGAFADERTGLTRLAAAAGPQPSTPRQAQAEAAIAAQRHALDSLARSDRSGCAVGAAIALALDWQHVRPILDSLAHRLGIAAPASGLPREEPMIDEDAATERARLFGARQLLVQQRGLWSLLEARAIVRRGD